jgi:hypothetical protein
MFYATATAGLQTFFLSGVKIKCVGQNARVFAKPYMHWYAFNCLPKNKLSGVLATNNAILLDSCLIII